MREEELTTAENYPQLMLENQLCFPLYATARRIVNLYTPHLKPLGLTYTQYIVFLCLWEYGKSTVGELCRRLYLDNGTITPLVKRMEQEGYVTRCRCKKDERIVHVELTEKGWALREAAREIPEAVGQCVEMSREQAEELFRLLHQFLEKDD